MKNYFSKFTKSRLVGKNSAKPASTAARQFVCVSGKKSEIKTAESPSIAPGGTLYGCASFVRGPIAEEDMRGLKPEFLQDQAATALFVHSLFLILAVNASLGVAWLAFQAAYAPAVLLAALASIVWKNAIAEAIRSARLHTAANTEFLN